ncbi:MAG: hypothetical protein AB7S57_19525 [Acetobacteraceae bacterium]
MPGKLVRPVWTYGPTDARARSVLFQCPVSAIPELAFDLLELWFDCRRVKALPVAGGWLDQPLVIRQAFPVFESEMAAVEARQRATAPQAAAAAAVAGVVAAQRGPARR